MCGRSIQRLTTSCCQWKVTLSKKPLQISFHAACSTFFLRKCVSLLPLLLVKTCQYIHHHPRYVFYLYKKSMQEIKLFSIKTTAENHAVQLLFYGCMYQFFYILLNLYGKCIEGNLIQCSRIYAKFCNLRIETNRKISSIHIIKISKQPFQSCEKMKQSLL